VDEGSYSNDGRGNLTALRMSTYGTQNRLTGAGSATLSYGAIGRLFQTTARNVSLYFQRELVFHRFVD